MRHRIFGQMTCAMVLAVSCGTARATDLFADNFDRADGTDLNAEATGKSGTLGPLNWVEVTSGADPFIETNTLKIGETGAGGGWSIAYVDHNFTDAAITTAGEFTISVDLVGPLNSNGGTRFLGFAIGQSLVEVTGWNSNNPTSDTNPFTTDFFIGYDTTGTNEVKIFTNGNITEVYQESINLDSGGNLSVRFFGITDFNAGSNVSYEASIDGGAAINGNFTWSGTDENYINLYSNYTTHQGTLDNFVISTPGGVIGDFDGDGDVDGVDVAEMFSNFTGPGGTPTNPATDLDGDGDTDGVDVATLFGLFTGPLTPTSVPEPTSLALLGLLAVGLSKRGGTVAGRRRR